MDRWDGRRLGQSDDPSIASHAYLKEVHERLPLLGPGELDVLLPDRWIAEHPQHRLERRVREAEQKAKRTRRAQRRRARERPHC